jgi:tetratricopeptide (TPR) repeat protein
MRIGKALLVLFFVLFSVTARGEAIDSLVLKLSSDIRAKESPAVIEKDVKKILKAKEHLPVNYVPEVNYLLGKEVEKIPPTGISTVKGLLYHLSKLSRAVYAVLFLIVFYTFLFYFQQIEGSGRNKLLLTLASLLVPVTFLFIGSVSLFLFSASLAILLNFRLEKKKTVVFASLGVLFIFLYHTFEENAISYLKSPKTLYSVKVERDGYVPEYLIDLALEGKLAKEVERASNLLAVGNFKGVDTLKKLKDTLSDSRLKAIILNNIGYYYFMKGKYKLAEDYFSASLKLNTTPFAKYNLYLTYSALLEVNKATELKSELEKDEFFFMKPVPLVIHVPASSYGFYFPLKEFLSILLGLALGALIIYFLPARLGSYEPQLLRIPGVTSYINGSLTFFLSVFTIVLLANYILGRTICSI